MINQLLIVLLVHENLWTRQWLAGLREAQSLRTYHSSSIMGNVGGQILCPNCPWYCLGSIPLFACTCRHLICTLPYSKWYIMNQIKLSFNITSLTELMGPKVSTLSPVWSSVKVIWLADMKLLRGERTTVLSMVESNTTRGKPPSMSPYTPVSGDHTPYLISLATECVCVCGRGGGGWSDQ